MTRERLLTEAESDGMTEAELDAMVDARRAAVESCSWWKREEWRQGKVEYIDRDADSEESGG